MGPMYLSALLKKYGHQCRLIITSEYKDYLFEMTEFDPDLTAFSTKTGPPHKWALETAQKIKEISNIPIILGGPHPTFFPEIIQEPWVDMICLGEGEFAVLKLANKLDENSDITQIRNLWIKQDGQIIKNELRPLVEDLDELLFPDRALYDDCKILLDKMGSSTAQNYMKMF